MAATLDARVRLNTAEFSGGMQRVLRESNAAVGRLNQSFGTLKNLALGGALGAGSLEIARGFLEASMNAERLRAALSATTGSDVLGRSQLKEIKSLAGDIGLGIDGAAKAMIQFQSAGMTAAESMRTIRAGFNAILSTGGGNEEFSRFAIAVQQMRNSPKPLQEEINQLREALPTTAKLMKEAFGTTRSEELQKLGISGREFVDTLLIALEKLPQIGDTMGKQIGRFQAQIEDFKATAGETFMPVLGQTMQKFSEEMKKLQDVSRGVADVWVRLFDGMDPESVRATGKAAEERIKKRAELIQAQKRALDDYNETAKKNAEAFKKSYENGQKLSDVIAKMDVPFKELAKATKEANEQLLFNDRMRLAIDQETRNAFESSLDETRRQVGDSIIAKREREAEAFNDFQGPPQQSEREKEAWRELARREGMSSSDRKSERRADREMERNARRAADRQTREEMRELRKKQREGAFDDIKNNRGFQDVNEEMKRRKSANREAAKAAMQTTEQLLTTIKDTLKNLATA